MLCRVRRKALINVDCALVTSMLVTVLYKVAHYRLLGFCQKSNRQQAMLLRGSMYYVLCMAGFTCV